MSKIHARACVLCPSVRRPLDPEVQDILTWPREHQVETVFRCAWRPGKLCRGYCDLLRLTEADVHEPEPFVYPGIPNLSRQQTT